MTRESFDQLKPGDLVKRTSSGSPVAVAGRWSSSTWLLVDGTFACTPENWEKVEQNGQLEN